MDDKFKCKRDSPFQEDAKNNNKHRNELNERIWEEAPSNSFLRINGQTKLNTVTDL